MSVVDGYLPFGVASVGVGESWQAVANGYAQCFASSDHLIPLSNPGPSVPLRGCSRSKPHSNSGDHLGGAVEQCKGQQKWSILAMMQDVAADE
jgi:hypothetical protein